MTLPQVFTQTVSITRYEGDAPTSTQDVVAIEAPLEIKIAYGTAEQRRIKDLSVTMRTPGHDADLCAGFLFTEGILRQTSDLLHIKALDENKILADLHPNVILELGQLERHFYTNSSCGVCGKTNVEAIHKAEKNKKRFEKAFFSPKIIQSLPSKMRLAQAQFETTGGIHASALFDSSGNLLLIREDVGRHNALDKLIGHYICQSILPPEQSILLLSGRASFELIQKAAHAGISTVCAVGAPSSLAIATAAQYGISLIGFLRDARFNIYTIE